ncbi:hypothetical protein A2963_05255 [Candidatus Roizmanbacteria bacterium RIFCSPLOWO2_01_FULL_40_13]|nr:MAG: hypothetical protein A2963_05255 [Candidatus Roizmanbacteria bacterium RIFCSPLOWO2_01_FULL_40_13]
MLKNKVIILIHKDRFEYFDGVQSKIFQFVFQSNLIQDLEVIDEEQIKNQIKVFVETNKLIPAQILFIVSDQIIFAKAFVLSPNLNKPEIIEKYLESIPFEHVSYKIIDRDKDFIVMAINKEIFTSLKRAFGLLGFQSGGIVAQSQLGEIYKNSQTLSSDIVRYTISHLDSLQKQGFIQEEIPKPEKSNYRGEAKPAAEKKPVNPMDKYRLPALILVFVILLGTLGFVVYKQNTPGSRANPVPQPVIAPAVISPTEEPILEESAPAGSPSAQTL